MRRPYITFRDGDTVIGIVFIDQITGVFSKFGKDAEIIYKGGKTFYSSSTVEEVVKEIEDAYAAYTVLEKPVLEI
jgi:hypothetical protein